MGNPRIACARTKAEDYYILCLKRGLQKRMNELGWNQKTLALYSSVNKGQISAYFTSDRALSLFSLERLLDALGIMYEDLLWLPEYGNYNPIDQLKLGKGNKGGWGITRQRKEQLFKESSN